MKIKTAADARRGCHPHEERRTDFRFNYLHLSNVDLESAVLFNFEALGTTRSRYASAAPFESVIILIFDDRDVSGHPGEHLEVCRPPRDGRLRTLALVRDDAGRRYPPHPPPRHPAGPARPLSCKAPPSEEQSHAD
jgi:hypothetical protein